MYLFKDFIPESFNGDVTNILNLDNTKSNVIFLNGLFCVNWVNVISNDSDIKISITSYNEKTTKFIPHHTYNQSKEAKLHHHDYFELMYVCDGIVEQVIEQGHYIYKKGQVCIMNRNTNHVEYYQSDSSVIFICFSLKILEQIFDINKVEKNNPLVQFFYKNMDDTEFYRKDYFHFNPSTTENNQSSLKKILEQIIVELSERSSGYISIVEGLFLRTFDILTNKTNYNYKYITLNSLKESFIFDQITNYFLKNYKTNRVELEKNMNYSGDYLNRVIKKHTNMSLTEYNNFICLKIAEEKLKDTKNPIYEIMDELKYENKSYFYRIFKNKNNCSPIDYREQYQRKPN